jgi:hypothetical protein
MPEPRRIPDPGFAGDTGGADPVLRAALEAYAGRGGGQAEVLQALSASGGSTRLLVPVVAVLGDVERDAEGRAHDKTSDMATALLTGRDGRRALLAFTSLETLAAWRPDARPVPVSATLAARSALQEGAAALVIDVAGPTMYAVEGDLLDALAHGWTLVRTPDGFAWAEAGEAGGGG